MKSVTLYPGKTVQCLQPADLASDKVKAAILQGKALWSKRCKAFAAAKKPDGSCVLGAGIACYFLPHRARRPSTHILIYASACSPLQGSLSWEDSKDEIISFLKQNGIPCFYEWGFMD